MQDKTQDKQLPLKTIPDKLSGAVHAQYVSCGKPNCKCARGELHGPYWYRFWREWDGKLHKEYVRKTDLEQVRAACEAQRQELREAQAVLARGRRAVKSYAKEKAGIRKRYDDPADLIADIFEPLRVSRELAKLALSDKGGVMVTIEATRIFFMLGGLLPLPGDKSRKESARQPGGGYAWLIGGPAGR